VSIDLVRRARVTWHRRRRQHDASVLEVCDILAAELRAGRDPAKALAAAAVVLPELGTVARVSRLGGDVPAALREAAVHDPAGSRSAAMNRLAAAWTVATTSGAGLAAVLDQVAADIRVVRALRHEVAAQLAGPRASARLLAALPLLGMGVGWGAGADPLAFLLGTPLGLGCLVVGASLATLGLIWVERLAKAAEPGP
jgi:tight adherence protein B